MPPPGSRAFPAPLVHTPAGTGTVRTPPRGGKSADCNNTAGVFAEWLRGPPLRPDGRVGCNVGFGLRPTAQSGRGGSGCCEEVVREEEDVDDATLDASSPGVLLPFDVPDVRRIELLRRGPTMFVLFSIGEPPPVTLDTPKEQPNMGPWLNEPLPLRELPLFLPLGST